jgi:hypothetical protein
LSPAWIFAALKYPNVSLLILVHHALFICLLIIFAAHMLFSLALPYFNRAFAYICPGGDGSTLLAVVLTLWTALVAYYMSDFPFISCQLLSLGFLFVLPLLLLWTFMFE